MTTPVEQGQVLVGKYRVERVLGQGGMGFVVAARNEQLDQVVALKFLLPEALANPDVVQRFFREARLASKLRGEHVARVFDVAQLESGSPFIVMEYLEGHDLATQLDQKGPLSFAEVSLYAQQACEGLTEAHAAGIVHRDLKPSNLFLARRADGSPCIKLLDFGISKAIDPDRNNFHTRTPTLPGTPHYMSPEQMRGSRTPDPRSDLWAMGVILYELSTGEYPFKGSNVAELYVSVLNENPVPPRSWRNDLPEAFERVVQRCLAKNPDERFQNAAELREALRAIGMPQPIPAGRPQVSPFAATLNEGARAARNLTETLGAPVPLPAAPPPPPVSHDPPSFDDTPRSAPLAPGRSPLQIAAAVSALCIGAVLFALLRPTSPPPPAASTAAPPTGEPAPSARPSAAPPGAPPVVASSPPPLTAAATAAPLATTAPLATASTAAPSPPATTKTAAPEVRKPRTAAPAHKAPDFGGRQ